MAYDNTFNVDSYFRKNYNLPDKPFISKKTKKNCIIAIIIGIIATIVLFATTGIAGILGLVIIAIPVIILVLKKSKIAAWNAAFEYRRTHWLNDFDKYHANLIASLKAEEAGMQKFDLDPDMLIDIKPFCVSGVLTKGKDCFYRTATDGSVRGSKNHITWFYFDSKQMYCYRMEYDVILGKKTVEETEEFFYKDIVNISTTEKTEEIKSTDGSTESINIQYLALTVPGDKMFYSYYNLGPEQEASIKAFKNKIRESKSSNDGDIASTLNSILGNMNK